MNYLIETTFFFKFYTLQILAKITDTTTQVTENIINVRWQADAQVLLLSNLSHLLPTPNFLLSEVQGFSVEMSLISQRKSVKYTLMILFDHPLKPK